MASTRYEPRYELPKPLATSVQPFAIRVSSSQAAIITARWATWLPQCEHDAARLASSMLPRDTILHVYQETHRRAMLMALARHISLSTIVSASLDDPLASDEERMYRLAKVITRRVRSNEIKSRVRSRKENIDARRT